MVGEEIKSITRDELTDRGPVCCTKAHAKALSYGDDGRGQIRVSCPSAGERGRWLGLGLGLGLVGVVGRLGLPLLSVHCARTRPRPNYSHFSISRCSRSSSSPSNIPRQSSPVSSHHLQHLRSMRTRLFDDIATNFSEQKSDLLFAEKLQKQNLVQLETVKTSLHVSSSSNLEDSDQDYGYFGDFLDDLEFRDEYETGRSLSSSSRNGSLSMSSHSSSISLSSLPRNSSSLVLFEEDNVAVSCRSFPCSISNSKLSVCIAVSGIRIVHEGFREYVEYKVKMRIDDQEFNCWKRFSEFESLGEACRHRANKTEKIKSHRLKKSLAAWQAVLDHRPWFWTSLAPGRLRQELVLLDRFIRNLLFEAPSLHLLVEFLLPRH